jgi:hypothetical protein
MAESHEIFYANQVATDSTNPPTDGVDEGKIDAISASALANNDACVCIDDANDRVLFYHYDSASAVGEAWPAPDVIRPYDFAAAGEWLLCHIAPYNCEAFKGFQGTAGANIIEFSSDGSLVGNSDTVVPTEQAVKEYCDSTSYIGGDHVVLESDLPGFIIRPQFIWKDADEIYIEPGVYHHNGTSEQMLEVQATLTWQAGSGGSNAASEDLDEGTLKWQYLYIDDSETPTTPLTASDFVANYTRPTFNHAKGAFYNGNDRCVFIFQETAAGGILQFHHDGGSMIQLASSLALSTNLAAQQAWTDSEMLNAFPKLWTTNFTEQFFRLDYTGSSGLFSNRCNGSANGTRTHLGRVSASTTSPAPNAIIVGDTDGITEFYNDDAADNDLDQDLSNIYLPKGM